MKHLLFLRDSALLRAAPIALLFASGVGILTTFTGDSRALSELTTTGRLVALGAPLVLAVGILVSWVRRSRAAWPWFLAAFVGVPLGIATVVPTLSALSPDGGVRLQSGSLAALRGFLWFVLLVSVILALRRREPEDPTESPGGWSRTTLVLLASFATLLVALQANWVAPLATTATWSQVGTHSARLAGRLPFSDAGVWYCGTLSVADGRSVEWSARRPVHVLLRAGEYVISARSYQASLLVQAALCAIAITALTLAVWRIFSLPGGLACWSGLVTIGMAFVGSYLSECTGLSVACLAAAALLRGCHDGRFGTRLLGFALLGGAWLVRPGPLGLLALPLVLEWGRREPKRFVRGLVAVAVLGIVLAGGKAAFAVIAKPTAGQNANAAITLYGLALGVPWGEALEIFLEDDPERRQLTAGQQAQLQTRLAREAFLADPVPALRSGVRNLWNGVRGLALRLPRDTVFRPWSFHLASLGAALCLIGAVGATRMLFRSSPGTALLFVAVWALGAASLPLIWGDGGMRGVMILFPFLLVFFSSAFAIRRLGHRTEPGGNSPRGASGIVYAGGGLALFLVALGTASYLVNHRSADEGSVLHLDLSRAASVFIDEADTTARWAGTPTISRSDAVAALRHSGVDHYGLGSVLAGVRTPALVFAHGYGGESAQWTIVEGIEPRDSGVLAVEETVRDENVYFRRATRWHWLDAPRRRAEAVIP